MFSSVCVVELEVFRTEDTCTSFDFSDLGNEPLLPDDTEQLMNQIAPDMHREAIAEIGSADFGYEFQGLARFRVSIFRTLGQWRQSSQIRWTGMASTGLADRCTT